MVKRVIWDAIVLIMTSLLCVYSIMASAITNIYVLVICPDSTELHTDRGPYQKIRQKCSFLWYVYRPLGFPNGYI